MRGDGRNAQAAFDRFVVPEIDVLLRVANAITRNPVEAEDLVQDTLLRAYCAIERFDGRHPRAWLLTIMRNAQRNRVRRRRPALLDEPDRVLSQVRDDSSHADTPENIVVGETFDAAVEQAFRALPERLRRPVELVDMAGLSYREAATALAVPVGTIMSRLHRARRRMREHVAEAGVAPRRRS